MNNLQLTGSAVFSFDSEIHTLFIASQDGRCGVVDAGSWETVIPFRFDRIEALAAGGFAAWRRDRRTVYHICPALRPGSAPFPPGRSFPTPSESRPYRSPDRISPASADLL